jgi:shikimate kinase
MGVALLPAPTDKIYLVGFMGAGKSTLARALASRLDWHSEDIDERIERRERLTVAQIFRQKGEPYFRQVEREVLWSLLPVRHVVVATGGGTFADPDTRAAMLVDGTVLWLDLPLEHLPARVRTDGRRPLAASREQLEALYHARHALYELAHHRFETGPAPVEELIERILDRLGW